jgi:hypothetical protein
MMKSDDDLYEPFRQTLWSDVEEAKSFPAVRPVLAHYTSIATLDAIMSNDELWFSNPLFMNDVEELRFGILEGIQAFHRNEAIRKACGSDERCKVLAEAFSACYAHFERKHAFDTYVLCLSEHEPGDTDGRLSMWRGYGSNGNGAAIVFDSAKIDVNDRSPLIFDRVTYASSAKRREWIEGKLTEFAERLHVQNVPTDKLYLPAHALFERIKVFALFTKHQGFEEEREWRAVYFPDRDSDHRLHSMFSYAIGRHGVEPKLRFKVAPIDGVTANDFSLSKLVHRILLGPSLSNQLAITAVRRMLEQVGKPELCERVFASTTPYRV